MKRCSKCKQEKPENEFSQDKTCRDRLCPNCKSCRKIYMAAYYATNRKKMGISKAAYRATHREERKVSNAAYYLAHREKIEAYKTNKIKNNLKYRLACYLRCRLGKALKGNYKTGSAVRDLGCTIEEFKKYIESKFQSGMTWENYGKGGWHLDHIIPVSSFDLSDPAQFRECWHYTNYQPLWAADNLSKGIKPGKTVKQLSFSV